MTLTYQLQCRKRDFLLQMEGAIGPGITGIFGPSGAGKTTFLNLIAGIEHADQGSISLAETTLLDSRGGKSLPVHERRIAMVFQEGRLFPHLTVKGNLLYGAARQVNHRDRFDQLVESLSLSSLLNKRPWQCSGGERQRVALGRALLTSPRLLLLDEPMASLDRGLKRQILPFLKRVLQDSGVPAIHVSHDLSELLQVTDQLMVMISGREEGRGNLLELIRRPEILRLFHDLGLPNVISLQVMGHNPDEGVSHFGLLGKSDGPWVGPSCDAELGQSCQVLLRPEDIAISLNKLSQVSVRNQIRGQIVDVLVQGSRVLCIVDVGIELLVDLTPHALHGLGLARGQSVWCAFKAHALQYLDHLAI